MADFLRAPQFTPPQSPIPIGNVGDVLTVVAGGSKALAFQPGGGGGGGAPLVGESDPVGLTGTFNDWAPAGFGPTHCKIFATCVGNTIITGLDATGFVDGELATITNWAGGFSLQLNFLDPGSAAFHQFLGRGGLGNNLQIDPGNSQLLVFSGGRTFTGWILI